MRRFLDRLHRLERPLTLLVQLSRRGLLIAAVLLSAAGVAFAADDTETVYTVGNYPVDAVANDAVAAKEKAVADGQQAAFRSLLKRLTPVTAYQSLAALRATSAANLVDGLSVRAERNSSTSYTATLDFSFQARRVRELLRSRGIPYVEDQAPETAVVLVFVAAAGQAPSGALTAAGGKRIWREAWGGLDLEHTLTPIKLHDAPASLTADLIKTALGDAAAPLRSIAPLAKSGQALLAVAEADPVARRLHVTLTGTDAVGMFVLKRSWRLDVNDAAYTAELAAVVALGTLEGRWKAVRRPGGRAAPVPASGQALQPVQIYVEFASMQDWQTLRRQMADLPGVADFSVGGLSARGADVALRYPGGGEPLMAALSTQNISLRYAGGTWIARPMQ